MLSQLLERTFNYDCGQVVEVCQSPEISLLIKSQLARKLNEEEIDGCVLPSILLGPLKEIEFEKNGEHFLCTPVDSIGAPVKLPISKVEFCRFEFPLAFKRLAELNGFIPRCEFMFGGKSVYHIGDLDLSIGRVGWFFVNDGDEFCLQGLSSLSFAKVLITSLDENFKNLCQKRGISFLPLPPSQSGWKLSHASFLRRVDGVTAAELSELSKVPLLIDTQNQRVFFYGVESLRNSINDYKYLHILATIGKNGMSHQSLFSAMELQGHDASSGVSDVRRRLKEAVVKTLHSTPDRCHECLQLLGLAVEKSENKKKGSLYRLNLSPDQIIIY